MAADVLSPSERLILAGYHAESMCEMLEEFADTDGVIRSESARAFWQKLLLASLGHSASEQAEALEKLWTRLGRLSLVDDPAMPLRADLLLADSFACADGLWQSLRGAVHSPAAMCMVMARLSALAAEALAAAEGRYQPPAEGEAQDEN